jgi:hypothetical protein
MAAEVKPIISGAAGLPDPLACFWSTKAASSFFVRSGIEVGEISLGTGNDGGMEVFKGGGVDRGTTGSSGECSMAKEYRTPFGLFTSPGSVRQVARSTFPWLITAWIPYGSKDVNPSESLIAGPETIAWGLDH